MENVVENYLEMINFISEGESLIEEGFSDIVKKLDPKKLKSLLPGMKKAHEEKNINKLYKITKSVPSAKIPLEKIEQLAKKSIPNFNNSFSLAQKVLSNTFPSANEKLIRVVSIGIAAKSSKDKNPIGETKKTLKKVSFDINKNTDELEKKNEEKGIKIPRSTLIDEIIGWTWVGFVVVGVGGVALITVKPVVFILLIFTVWYIINAWRNSKKQKTGISDFNPSKKG